MGTKNITIAGSVTGGTVVAAENYTVNVSPSSERNPTYYPPGCIGANLAMRNYVKYLVDRYHHYRRADASFGRKTQLSYAVLFKNIQARFKASVYFIQEGRFSELADYLHGRIDQTILGKRNRARGHSNYVSFDEYQLEHGGSDAVKD